MRILVNGYFYGGNCPPFVNFLKKIHHETKVTNALSVLDDHGVNGEFLKYDDILPISLKFFEKVFVILSKKFRLLIWKPFLTWKAAKIVNDFKPDIIINHKASVKADIMLGTGFRPQLTYIYGGEVHGGRVGRRELDYVFKESEYILTTTEQMKNHLVSNRKELQPKVKVFPLGYFGFDRINQFKKDTKVDEVRSKYGFRDDEIVFLDSRSLRGPNAGFKAIIKSLKKLVDRGFSFKMIFLRGYLGTDFMVNNLRKVIRNDEVLANHIVLVDEILSEEQIIEYYFLSNAFVSLLPADQCGKSINDAVFLDCSLILTDLEVYRKRLGNGPSYVSNQDVDQVVSTFQSVIEGKEFKVQDDDLKKLVSMSDSLERFRHLNKFIEKVVGDFSGSY